MRHQRPAVLTAAVAICVVNSLGNIATLASPVARPIAYTSLVLAPIGVIGAIGLWRLMRWGALLSTGVLALTAPLAAPGIVVAPILVLHAFGRVDRAKEMITNSVVHATKVVDVETATRPVGALTPSWPARLGRRFSGA